MVKPYLLSILFLLSTNLFELQDKNTVFAIAVSGVVLGVNAEVYSAVPFRIRTLEM